MKIHKSFIAIGMIIAFSLFFELALMRTRQIKRRRLPLIDHYRFPGRYCRLGPICSNWRMTKIWMLSRYSVKTGCTCTQPRDDSYGESPNTRHAAHWRSRKPGQTPSKVVLSRKQYGPRIRLLESATGTNFSGPTANGCCRSTMKCLFRDV